MPMPQAYCCQNWGVVCRLARFIVRKYAFLFSRIANHLSLHQTTILRPFPSCGPQGCSWDLHQTFECLLENVVHTSQQEQYRIAILLMGCSKQGCRLLWMIVMQIADPQWKAISYCGYTAAGSGGGDVVELEGSFDNWHTRQRMQRTGKDFTLVKLLPPGVYQVKLKANSNLANIYNLVNEQ